MDINELQIKALLDGLDVNFKNISEIDEFIEVLIVATRENPDFDGEAAGDCDGLLISDNHNVDILCVIAGLKKVKFVCLIEPMEMIPSQTKLLAQTILSTASALIIWHNSVENNQPIIFDTPETIKQSKSINPGDSFVYKFINDGFGLY